MLGRFRTTLALMWNDRFFRYCALVLIAGIWASSGTLAPYAITLDSPDILEKCQYPVNIDHEHFAATFRFLRWESQGWQFSVMLRRLLYPIIAWLPMTLFGFMLGGFLVSLAIQIYAMFSLSTFLQNRFDERTRKIALLLLIFYPGIHYWAGLPYSHLMIVPCTIWLSIKLFELEASSPKNIFRIAFWMGVLTTGYDLLPIFAPAGILLLALRKLWTQIPAFIGGMLVAPVTILLFLKARGQSLIDSNSESYVNIIKAYLHWPEDKTEWLGILSNAPKLAWFTYLHSNFSYLPFLFIICLTIGLFWKKIRFERVELLLLLVLVGLFLFNNLAPPYVGRWQMRGDWIARIYQPLFIVYLLYCSRTLARLWTSKWLLGGILLMYVAANGLIIFGPLTGHIQETQYQYYNFYKHASPEAYSKNYKIHGIRPLGFCKSAAQTLN